VLLDALTCRPGVILGVSMLLFTIGAFTAIPTSFRWNSEALLAVAPEAVHAAKHGRRNRVSVAPAVNAD
jgi:hypothetical protein